MAVMDEFKEEREAVKNGSIRKKLSYFFYYYKWRVVIAIVIIVASVSCIYSIATNTDTILCGMLINSQKVENVAEAADRVSDGFLKFQNIDTSKYDMVLNTSVSYMPGEDSTVINSDVTQVITMQSAAGMLDFMTGDLQSMSDLVELDLFADLREVFDEQELAQYESNLIYVNQIPMFIDMSQSKELRKVYGSTEETIVFGIATSVEDLELTVDFMNYLLEK